MKAQNNMIQFYYIPQFLGKIWFVFFLLSCHFHAYAQQIVPLSLLNTNNLWSIIEYDGSFSPDHLYPTLKTTWLKVEGDTILNSVAYKIAWSSTGKNHESWEIDNFMREGDGKIFYKTVQEPEMLLYDFSLQEKDTFVFYRDHIPLVTHIDSIKDITLNDSTYKAFFVSNYKKEDPGFRYTEIIIEGIGSLNGLFRKSCALYTGCYQNSSLTCFYQDDTQLYQSPDYNKCYYDSVIINNTLTNSLLKEIKVYPNPSEGKFYVQVGNNLDDYTCKVFDIAGNQVQSFTIKNSYKTEINLVGTKPGVYLLQVVNRNRFGVVKLLMR